MEWFLLEEWVLQIKLKLQERVIARLLFGHHARLQLSGLSVWMPFGCVPASLKRSCNGDPCPVVDIYPVFPEHLMLCKQLVNTSFHGSGCTVEEIVFCQCWREACCTRLLSDGSVACGSFPLEMSQDLKRHALVNYLIWFLDRKQ